MGRGRGCQCQLWEGGDRGWCVRGERVLFLTTESGAGEANTTHCRRAGPLRKAGAGCRPVTLGGAGIKTMNHETEVSTSPKPFLNEARSLWFHPLKTQTNQPTLQTRLGLRPPQQVQLQSSVPKPITSFQGHSLCPPPAPRPSGSLTIHCQPRMRRATSQTGAPGLSPAHIVTGILQRHGWETQRGPRAQHLAQGRDIRDTTLGGSPVHFQLPSQAPRSDFT